jgi:hypothetical protein
MNAGSRQADFFGKQKRGQQAMTGWPRPGHDLAMPGEIRPGIPARRRDVPNDGTSPRPEFFCFGKKLIGFYCFWPCMAKKIGGIRP